MGGFLYVRYFARLPFSASSNAADPRSQACPASLSRSERPGCALAAPAPLLHVRERPRPRFRGMRPWAGVSAAMSSETWDRIFTAMRRSCWGFIFTAAGLPVAS